LNKELEDVKKKLGEAAARRCLGWGRRGAAVGVQALACPSSLLNAPALMMQAEA
jgi:hypothetical protein